MASYLRIYISVLMLALATAQYMTPPSLTSSTTSLNIVFDTTPTTTTGPSTTTAATTLPAEAPVSGDVYTGSNPAVPDSTISGINNQFSSLTPQIDVLSGVTNGQIQPQSIPAVDQKSSSVASSGSDVNPPLSQPIQIPDSSSVSPTISGPPVTTPSTIPVQTEMSKVESTVKQQSSSRSNSLTGLTNPSVAPSSLLPTSVFGSSIRMSTGSSIPTPESPVHVQIIFGNNFTKTVGERNNTTVYSNALVPAIAKAANVPTERISNLMVISQPETDLLVLRFTILPYPANASYCWWTSQCGATVQSAVASMRLLAAPAGGWRLNDVNGTSLTVASSGNNIVFQSWSDDGLCPTSRCKQGTEVCNCTLTGNLYCSSSSSTPSGPQLLYLLLLLLLIPIIYVIIAVILVRRDISERSKTSYQSEKREKRMVRADMLSYHEYVAREKVQPSVATVASRSTLSASTLNTLHRSLGENLSIAFNGSTFVDFTGTDNSDASSSDSILPSNQ